jgi:glycosyltransferase involved in cell wall biosynthesis
MMRPVALVVPGDLETRTGGYIYDRRIVDGLRASGWTVDVKRLDASFPRPAPAATNAARHVFANLPGGTLALVDSLALGAIPEIIEEHGSRIRIVALMHLPLAADIGLDRETAAHFAEGERRALRAASLVVVTGHATIPMLVTYAVAPSKVVVIEPGTDPAPVARGSGGGPLQLLTVATLNPGKGHDQLITALAAMPSRNWRLTCAGSLTRHPETVARVRAMLRDLNLEDRVALVGELDANALEAQYDRTDLFVLATLRETYGMALAESLAHGIPAVTTSTGAAAELVGTDAGLLVAPGDVEALTDALTRFLTDEDLRSRLAAGARRVRPTLRRWDETIAQLANTLESIGDG